MIINYNNCTALKHSHPRNQKKLTNHLQTYELFKLNLVFKKITRTRFFLYKGLNRYPLILYYYTSKPIRAHVRV